MDNIFQHVDPTAGIAPNLIPNPPPEMPGIPGAGDAVAALSPFSEPQDVDSIIKQLVLDRPLKLYIPERDKYPDWDFRIINSIPQEMADAANKGFKPVTDPKFSALFNELVAGTDKDGKAYRPILCARPKAVTQHIVKRNRQQLQSLYQGMNPENRGFESKYAKNAGEAGGSAGQFDGPNWRIRA